MRDAISQDRLLVKRLLKGDRPAFDQFFADQFPRIYRFVLSRSGGDHDLAEELAQETLCRSLEKLKAWRGEAGLTTWLFTISRNLMTDRLRSPAGRVVSFGPADPPPEIRAALESLDAAVEDPENAGMSAQLKLTVQAALDYLPARQAQVLSLKYLRDHPVSQIAAHLKITEKAVESLLSRGRAGFRDAFNELAGAAGQARETP
ncbi:MAG: RNA polymerase sigma factor [Pseudomonadota bacterium]